MKNEKSSKKSRESFQISQIFHLICVTLRVNCSLMENSPSGNKWFVLFPDARKSSWLREVCRIQQTLKKGIHSGGEIVIKLHESITPQKLQPFHIVLLAALSRYIRRYMYSGLIIGLPATLEYLNKDLRMELYIRQDVPYVKGRYDADLNLWKVSADQSLVYSSSVAQYLTNRYFVGKDLSPLKVVLDELYANIADHSKSEETAYSFIHYAEREEIIRIAFCDFGIGIPASLMNGGIYSTSGYVKLATERGVSVRSNSHNRGFGLDTVVSNIADTDSPIRIISGNELFISYGDNLHERTYFLPYSFDGTLIYFDIPVNSFEDEDFIDDFSL